MQNAPLLIRTLHIYVWYKLLFLEYTFKTNNSERYGAAQVSIS